MANPPISVWNPATEDQIAEVHSFTRDEVTSAIAKAEAAQRLWRLLPIAERQAFLFAVADIVDRHRDELAALESRDVGKPIRAARAEVAGVASCFRYYAGALDKSHGDTISLDDGVSLTFHEPIGVVGIITPWNFPLPIASWNIAPALAAGNSVIVKPATLTPLSTHRLGELIAGITPIDGLFQVVTGAGSTVGAALIEDPRVGKISFTGSTEVGRSILRSSADTMKRVTLELGGKSANVVFADADVAAAAAAAPWAVFDNSGQDCCARSRILVQRSVLDDFIDGFVAATKALRIGAPDSTDTDLGPLVSAEHRETVAGFLDPGLDYLYRGEAPEGRGHWMAPHIVLDPSAKSRAAVEEVFGPVAVVIPFDTEEEAVALANDSIYGLSGSIWTRDVARSLRVARQIESGTLSVNSNSSIRVQTPFGGVKQSGMGRELGLEGLLNYSELKTVYLKTDV
ncbi:aldehyde dehydrogenase family protein [Leucobacter ruminantium]|uniref:Aldehyde dehydrogenase n=1 Tax=Leucobacter ruminantium TaxID=1289170 RepID=A0A939RZ63_9MICO|nr:aldehyde dehydrogenase family protein [Leucobacter ruminantium]MBO1806408.1 aldehyde dehydrogenase [Leucobacter ruminantium]